MSFLQKCPRRKKLFRSLQTAVVTSALQNFVSKEEKPKSGAPAAKPVRYQPSFKLQMVHMLKWVARNHVWISVDRFSYVPSPYHISRYIEACFKFSEPKLMPKRSQYTHYNKPKVEISFNISSFESEASGYPVWNITKFIYIQKILCRCLFFIDFSAVYTDLKNLSLGCWRPKL